MNAYKAIWWAIFVGAGIYSATLWGNLQATEEAQRQSVAVSEAFYEEGYPWLEINQELRIETTTLAELLSNPHPEGEAAAYYLDEQAMKAVYLALGEESFFRLVEGSLNTDQGAEASTMLVVKGPRQSTVFVYPLLSR